MEQLRLQEVCIQLGFASHSPSVAQYQQFPSVSSVRFARLLWKQVGPHSFKTSISLQRPACSFSMHSGEFFFDSLTKQHVTEQRVSDDFVPVDRWFSMVVPVLWRARYLAHDAAQFSIMKRTLLTHSPCSAQVMQC